MGIRSRFALWCILVLLLGSFACSAQSSAQTAPHAFSLEQVLSSSFPTNLVVADHAGRIAWVFTCRGERNVWIADAPNFEARQVTHYAGDDGMPIAALKLTPDGRTVVYARGSESNSAGETADPTSNVEKRAQQVWAADVEKGEPRLLGDMGCDEEDCEDVQISPNGEFAVWTAKKQIWIAPISGKEKAKALTFARGNNAQPKWSPDGKRIAFVSDRGDHSFVAIYEFGRTTLRYASPSADRDLYPRWSPDGSHLAFVRLVGKQMKQPLIPQTPLPWAIWVYDVANDSGREIWKSGPALDDSLPELTEDGSFKFAAKNRIVFSSEQDGWNHLYSVATTGGQATLLTPGSFETEDVALSSDKASVIYSSNQAGGDPQDVDRRHLWRVGVEGGTPEALTRGETMEWTPLEIAGKVVCLGSTATTPAMPYAVTAHGREMIAKAALPADFPTAQLVTPKQVIFKAADGWEIHGQLFEPKFEPKMEGRAPRPALIFIHGGSIRQMMLGFHYMDYYHNAYAMNQYLASRGYVVLSVNYRTGIMYGRHFREPKDGGPRGGAEYKDIVAAGKYLQSLPNVDTKRIGLWGGSYGGYLTAMGLAHDSDLFAAGVDLHGVHDWSDFKEDIPADAPDHDDAVKLAFQSSPNAAIATWRSPVLLIQGDDDRNVPFSQTVDLLQRLRQQKVHVEQLVFPDEFMVSCCGRAGSELTARRRSSSGANSGQSRTSCLVAGFRNRLAHQKRLNYNPVTAGRAVASPVHLPSAERSSSMSARIFFRPSILRNQTWILCCIAFLLANAAWAASKENVLYAFLHRKDGGNPASELVFDNAGNLYGTTTIGGIPTCGPTKRGCGTVFQLCPNPDGTWTENILHRFADGLDGSFPEAGLVSDAAGNLYGTTGTTVFQLVSSGKEWTENILLEFDGVDGSGPDAALVFDNAGNLYGTTYSGGTGKYSSGTAFQLVPEGNDNWTENVLYSFIQGDGGGYPSGQVAVDSAGNVYGTTAFDGTYGAGVVFELTPSPSGGWTEIVLHEFAPNFKDGGIPYAGLIFDAEGNLYGTTVFGGAYGYGTVYKLSPWQSGWKETILYNFRGGSDAGNPNQGNLIFDQAGNLYGMTYGGGNANCRGGCGTAYKLTHKKSGRWSESVLYSFQGTPDGYLPFKGLVIGENGHLYGTTYYGGNNRGCESYPDHGCGVVFEIIP